MNSSFTIWYNSRNINLDNPSLDLHINLWANNINKKRSSIDFGLMIKNPKKIKELFFYIPFNICFEDINNLTTHLCKDKESSSLVFNDDVILGKQEGELVEIGVNNKEFEYYLLDSVMLDSLDEIKFENGKILKFNFDENLNNKDKYLRFRISNIFDKGLIENYSKTVYII